MRVNICVRRVSGSRARAMYAGEAMNQHRIARPVVHRAQKSLNARLDRRGSAVVGAPGLRCNADVANVALPAELFLAPVRFLAGDDRIAERELSGELQEALRGLDETYRTPVLLSDVLGWSYAEIGELLGIAEGTVKSRIFRGRGELARRLGTTSQSGESKQ